MRRRRMKWSGTTTTTATILISLLLLLIPIAVVHGFANEEENEEKENESLGLELVHRHDPRLAGGVNGEDGGEMDQLEAVKGFIHRDRVRRQRMNQRWGLHHDATTGKRRKEREITSLPSFEMAMQAGRDYGLGEYFVEVEVGTPGQRFWLVADTGNELTWFNCLPGNHSNASVGGHHHHHHHHHHKKHHKRKSRSTRSRRRTKRRRRPKPCANGVFCPRRSSSFEAVTCSSRKCKVDLSDLFSLAYCPRPSDPCRYDISYVDGSSAKGFFGTDTISLNLTNGKKGKLQNLTIGCTRSILNSITYNEDTGGILGLGYAKDSFVSKAAEQYGGKFSYCLVDHLSHKNVSSYLTFGNTSPKKVKLLTEIRKTELVLAPPLYGVNVIGISIGGQMLKIPPQVWDFDSQGGTMIDSGTTLTTLIDLAYEPVLEALSRSLAHVKRVEGDFGVLDFCFDGERFDESSVPRLAFHFSMGARFEPPVKSYIIDVAPQVKCVGIVETVGPGASIIGNIMQQNYLWEFDLDRNTIGFAPSTCT